MTTKITRWKPPLSARPSRQKLREWLLQSGPKSTTDILTYAVEVLKSTWDLKELERDLHAHPRMFRRTGAAWTATPPQQPFIKPRKRTSGVTPSTFRRPSATTTPQPPHASRPSDKPTPQDTPIQRGNGRVTALTFRQPPQGGSGATPVGRRLLVTLSVDAVGSPQEAEQLVTDLTTQSGHIQTFEERPDSHVTYRGERKVIDAYTCDNEIRIIVAAAHDHDVTGVRSLSAFQRTRQKHLENVAAHSSTALSRPIAELARIKTAPQSLRPLIKQPPAQKRCNEQHAHKEATDQLNAVVANPKRWDAFEEWLATKKTVYHQELLETILVRALYTEGIDPRNVIESSYLLLGETVPVCARFATAFATATCDHGEDDLSDWISV